MRKDVARALGAGEQVLAVVGVEEFAERLDAADDHQEIVLAAEREHRIDEIVPRALLAELDLQAVGEESEKIARKLLASTPNLRPFPASPANCRLALPFMIDSRSAVLDNQPDHTQRRAPQRIRILAPVGFSSIAQKPTSVSILSASATATLTGSVGTRSAGPCGL